MTTEHKQPDLSIVVPVYNVEQYLEECLDSILVQPIENYEVILINDGSKDGSGDICQRYVENHPTRFRCICQENQGLSVARNVGISAATGTYILFLDSDDTLTNDNALYSLLKMSLSQELDIGIGNFKHLYEDDREEENRSIIVAEKCSGLDWLYKSLKKRKYLPAVWAKLYKCSFLLESNLLFVPRLINEDQLFTIQALKKAQTVAAQDCVFYRYRHRQNSITSKREWNSDLDRVNSSLSITKQLMIETESMNGEFKDLILSRGIRLLKSSMKILHQDICNLERQKTFNQLLKVIDELKLDQYFSVKRLTHIGDKIALRKGFLHYLKRN